MKTSRTSRRLAAAAAMIWIMLAANASGAQAAEYPVRPIRFLVGVAPGGGTDYVARLIAQKLSDKWVQPVVTDNRTGATGLIAMELTARATPDGYTCIVFNIGHLMSAALSRKAALDTTKDFAPVSLIALGTLMLASHSSLPATNLAEFIAYAKSRPGQLNYASGGSGGTQHLAMELFKHVAGIDLTHVPYKGSGPGTLALLSGQVQAFITNVLALYTHVKTGRLRALAVANPKRNPLVPEVPTFAELGYLKVDVNLWQGIMLPAQTPPAIVEKLSRAIVEAVHSPDVVEKLATQGAEPAGTSPREFADFLQSERSKWLTLIKEANIAID
ncbi:MAG: hypothetical protein A3G80_00905 [Betaproteobacteria bacterium RIFCSPLOWO2_12_FULL_62_13b]|nr:MAG: hypothetical protein A3G80_00905 [Betaproteobacteria bacterium RIFCSPLOWO2_12_FULL_62_13b]